MALSWMERLAKFFSPVEVPAVVEAPVETKPVVQELTEFEKIMKAFDPRLDMIVIGQAKLDTLSKDERDWLNSLGNRVHYFARDLLVNIAIVRTI